MSLEYLGEILEVLESAATLVVLKVVRVTVLDGRVSLQKKTYRERQLQIEAAEWPVLNES